MMASKLIKIQIQLTCIELKHDDNHLLHRQWRQTLKEIDDTDAGAIVDGFISLTVIHGGLSHVNGHQLKTSFQAQ